MAEIGRSFTHLQIESIQCEFKNDSKTKTVMLARKRGPNMEGSLRRPKLAIGPHLCKSNQFNEFKNDSKTKTVILARMRGAGPDPPRGIAGS